MVAHIFRSAQSATSSGAGRRGIRRPDIALRSTDTVLPGVRDGAELARAARGCRPDLTVLHTSGYREAGMLPYALPDNGMELIAKPCRRNGVARKIHEKLTGPAE